MPYTIKKIGTRGFIAVDNKGKTLSNHPLSKKQVQKQIIAVHLSKLKKTGKSDVFKK